MTTIGTPKLATIKVKHWGDLNARSQALLGLTEDYFKQHVAGVTFYCCEYRPNTDTYVIKPAGDGVPYAVPREACEELTEKSEKLTPFPNKEEVAENYGKVLKNLADQGRNLMDGVPNPRGSMPALGAPYGKDIKDQYREHFCRYKGISEDEFLIDLTDYALEFNAYCAGWKAGQY